MPKLTCFPPLTQEREVSVEAGPPPGLLGTLPARETRPAVIPVSFQALKGMGVSGERAENKSVCVCARLHVH